MKHVRLLFVVSIALLVGCQAGQPDLVRNGTVSVHAVDSRVTKVGTPSVQKEGDELIIRGRVERRQMYSAPLTGAVRIERVAPDGTVIDSTASQLRHPTRRGRTRVASYESRVSWDLREGDTLRVTMGRTTND